MGLFRGKGNGIAPPPPHTQIPSLPLLDMYTPISALTVPLSLTCLSPYRHSVSCTVILAWLFIPLPSSQSHGLETRWGSVALLNLLICKSYRSTLGGHVTFRQFIPTGRQECFVPANNHPPPGASGFYSPPDQFDQCRLLFALLKC